jgi:predicted ester cyclase
MAETDTQPIHELLARYSDGDSGAVSELIAREFFTYDPGDGEETATEVFARFAVDLKAAAPDLRVEIRDLDVGEDGRLRGTAIVTGTHSAPLWGVPPSGRRHRFEIPVTVRPADGRYAVNVELAVPAVLAILRELGLVNPPDQMHLPTRHPVVIDDFLVKVLFTGQVADKPCPHLADVRVTRPTADVCDDCGPDDVWPALRMCLTCGHVGCCDTSTNKHAKAHWEESGHPLMRSIRTDEGWIWCYADDALFQRRTLEAIEARLAAAS